MSKSGDLCRKVGNNLLFLLFENKDTKMTTFIGDFSCSIDSKGRVIFPSTFKKQLSVGADNRFVIKKDIFEKCLTIYPMNEWERQIEILRKKLNPHNKKHQIVLRGLLKGAIEVSFDGSNRLLIPRRLLEKAEITKEVIMIGEDDKIEMWDKDLYESIVDDGDDFANLVNEVLGGDNDE